MDYAKVSIPRPLFDRLSAPEVQAQGFRSASDAATHAIRAFLGEKGAA